MRSRLFSNKTLDQRIANQADDVVSRKENLDALSWGRVSDIGYELQNPKKTTSLSDLGRELVSIAQTNTSMLWRMGINTHQAPQAVMPSGIEIHADDTYTHTTLQSGQDSECTGYQEQGQRGQAPTRTACQEQGQRGQAPTRTEGSVLLQQPQQPVDQPQQPIQKKPIPEELTVKNSGAEKKCVEEFIAQKPTPEQPFLEKGVPEKAPLNVTMFEKSAPKESVSAMSIHNKPILEESALREEATKEVVSETFVSEEPTLKEVVSEKPAVKASSLTEPPSEQSPSESSTENPPSESPSGGSSSELESLFGGSSSFECARFKHLYSSRDGKMCLYEDADGHLVAVNPDRFA